MAGRYTTNTNKHDINEMDNTRVILLLPCQVARCKSRFNVYLRHVIRGHWERAVRPRLLEGLLPHEVLLVCDFKMKFLMAVFREAMSDFFGKAGIPWHGWMFFTKPSTTSHHVEVEYSHDITNDRKEDSFMVLTP